MELIFAIVFVCISLFSVDRTKHPRKLEPAQIKRHIAADKLKSVNPESTLFIIGSPILKTFRDFVGLRG